MDICLVNMPYAEVPRPSAALGLLQAVLEADGLNAASIYANLMFAEQMGMIHYMDIAQTRPQDGVADWTFAHIAFPGFAPDHDRYVDCLMQRHWMYRRMEREQLKKMIFRTREAAAAFIDTLVERILEKKASIVGCSSTFLQQVPSLALLRRIHELAPDVITMLGGANCETIMGRTCHRSFPWVDYVVSGEAEGFIARLVRDILKDGRRVPSGALPEGVFGPAHRTEGYPCRERGGRDDAPRAISESLEGQPVPNYDDYFETLNSLQGLREVVFPGLVLETSRGCWWGQNRCCTFCGLNGLGKKFRRKSATQVLRDMETLYSRYGVDRIETVDNVMDMGYFKTLIPELERAGSPYSLFFEVRVNLSRRQVKALRSAGVTWIQPGIESLSTPFLQLMDKGQEAWQNIQLLKWCREYGVRASWFILRDFPNEDDRWYGEMAELIPLITHLQPPLNMLPLLFCRYSHYHNRAQEYDIRLEPPETFFYIYPLDHQSMGDLVYFFDEVKGMELERNALLSSLVAGEGRAKLRLELAEWLRSFDPESEKKPILEMTIAPGSLHIRDTRPAAIAPFFTLTGVEREVYLACDEGPKEAQLFEEFERNRVSHKTVDGAILDLLDKKLLMALDGRFIALAVRGPLGDLPARWAYPGGMVDMMRRSLPDNRASA